MNRLTVLTGLPFSGKSTYVRSECRGMVVVDCDNISHELYGDSRRIYAEANDLVWREATRRVREALLAGRDVVVDAVNPTAWSRRHWVKLREAGYCDDAVLVVFEDSCVDGGMSGLDPVRDAGAAYYQSLWEAVSLEGDRYDDRRFVWLGGREESVRETLMLADLVQLKLLALDFDGVFTDNTSFGYRRPDESLRVEGYVCNHADGTALSSLREYGVPELCVVTSQQANYVAARCDKLKIKLATNNSFNGVESGFVGGKAAIIQKLADERGLTMDQVGFVGNDRHDVPALELVGVPIIVADAEACVWPYAKYVSERPGGHGALRDICDAILSAKGVWSDERLRIREVKR